MIVVAQLALVLWGVLLIFGIFAWAVVVAICHGVRRLNEWEAMRHAQNPADPWPELETGDWPTDG